MATGARGGSVSISFLDRDLPGMSSLHSRVAAIDAAIVHVAVRAGDTRCHLLVRYTHTACASIDVIAEVVGIRET